MEQKHRWGSKLSYRGRCEQLLRATLRSHRMCARYAAAHSHGGSLAMAQRPAQL